MADNNIIARTDAEALIDVQLTQEIIQGIVAESAVLKHGKKLPNMTSNQTKLRVLDSLPVAGFVSGDTGLKPTSEVKWKNKYINAEEIAVIIPIPEAVLADASYDIWAQIKPRIVEAFGKVIDSAVLYGKDKPANWEEGIIKQAVTAENFIAYDASKTLYAKIDETMAKVEEDGFMPTAILGGVRLKSGFRNMVDSTGQPITGTEIDSIPRDYVINGSWQPEQAEFIAGDFNDLVYAIRQDMTYKVLTEAVISDASGKVLYNLAQQDMVALRCVLRLGWATPNPINALNTDGAKRYPFAVAKGSNYTLE